MTYEDYKKIYDGKKGTVEDALALIKSGDVIWCSNNYNEPQTLFGRLHEIADRVDNVIVYKSRIGRYPFMVTPGMNGHINCHNYFYGPSYRESHKLLNASFIPVDLPNYYRMVNRHKPCNIFTAQVSPMDENGNMYIGMNQTIEYYAVKDAIEQKKTIICEVNPNLTYMNGSAAIPVEAVTLLYEVDTPEYCIGPVTTTPEEDKIGEMVASLIEDGDTIQMGIGGIPDTVGKHLMDKKDLGLHTEQFTSSMATLIDAGVITGARKAYDQGLHVGVFADGTHELYQYLHNNPKCLMKPGPEVLNPGNIARQDHMVSINTLVEIDLTGQVCAESIGPVQYSGSGGGFCFTLGTYFAEHGKGILCFSSRTKKGLPKIKATLTPGAVVTHQRNYIQYVVTENGIADLRGTTVRERAKLLIGLAHPDDREELTRAAKELYYF
jgi:acyl-CoA hydrolase